MYGEVYVYSELRVLYIHCSVAMLLLCPHVALLCARCIPTLSQFTLHQCYSDQLVCSSVRPPDLAARLVAAA